LGIQPQADFANQIPTEKQLHDFEVYVKEKSDEKVRHLWLSFIILLMIISYKIMGIYVKMRHS